MNSRPSYASRNAADKEGDAFIRAAIKLVFAEEGEASFMRFTCEDVMPLLEKTFLPEKVPTEEEVGNFLFRKIGGWTETLHNKELEEVKEVVRYDGRYL